MNWMLALSLSLVFIPPSFAALSIKPGLWTMETKMKKDGKEYDPQAQMKAAMAKMSPEQKKQMQAMMEKMGHGASAFNLNEKGIQICFTGEMLKNEEFLNQHRDSECATVFPIKTANHVVTEFKCKSGATGKAEWTVKDSTHYSGIVNMTDKKGTQSEIDYRGTFASADCGKVKPIESVMTKKATKN